MSARWPTLPAWAAPAASLARVKRHKVVSGVVGALVVLAAVGGGVGASQPGNAQFAVGRGNLDPSPSSATSRAVAGSPTPTSSPVSAVPRTSSSPAVAPTSSATVPATSAPTGTAPPGQTRATHPVRAGTALAALSTLAVKGRAPMTGYSRAQFGPAWADTDRNGCDTRNDVLRRDLVNTTIKPGTHGCVVLAGDAAPERYTGQDVHFVYGGASELDIDHVVALGDAWQKGAQQWAAGERLAFANDPLNLLAVDASANRQKGDGDAATWLPPNKSYRCAYVAQQVGVKVKYHVWVTAAERDAIARVLTACPDQPLPTGGNRIMAAVAPTATHSSVTAPPAPPRTVAPTSAAPPPATATDPRFGTCKEAIAAGFGPYREGVDPEYAWYRDGDHDGIDCERSAQ